MRRVPVAILGSRAHFDAEHYERVRLRRWSAPAVWGPPDDEPEEAWPFEARWIEWATAHPHAVEAIAWGLVLVVGLVMGMLVH